MKRLISSLRESAEQHGEAYPMREPNDGVTTTGTARGELLCRLRGLGCLGVSGAGVGSVGSRPWVRRRQLDTFPDHPRYSALFAHLVCSAPSEFEGVSALPPQYRLSQERRRQADKGELHRSERLDMDGKEGLRCVAGIA